LARGRSGCYSFDSTLNRQVGVDRIPMVVMVLTLMGAGATPLPAQKPPRPSPTLVGTPATTSRPATTATPAATAQPAGTATKAARPSPALAGAPASAQPTSPHGAGAVQPQAARSGTPAAPAPMYSAGLGIEPYTTDAEMDVYARRYARRLDSVIVTLVGVFRGTSGQPLAGAAAPTALSQRERDRWNRCRDLHWDLQSYASAARDLAEGFEEPPAAVRAAAALDSALTALDATSECDNVASMVASPERWTPWGPLYEMSARRFYTEWYAQVREVHVHNRALILALNGVAAPGERIPVPPALPRTPPYAGAGPR
jgi:hypothetical protein